MVTMFSQPQNPLSRRSATLFPVARPLLAVPHKPPYQHEATLRSDAISRVPHLAVAQALDKNEAEGEPEQFTETAWLTEATKSEPEQLIENKGSHSGRIFC
jgi:hypothetical protein